MVQYPAFTTRLLVLVMYLYDIFVEDKEKENEAENPPQKQQVQVQFKIHKDVAKLMTADEINKNLWNEVKTAAKEGYQVKMNFSI